MNEFEPHPLLRNAHAMTLAAAFWPRRYPRLSASTDRLFEVEPDTRLLGRCHWQRATERPTLLLVHGLEGSSESGYMLGTAEKAFAAGFHVVRLNQRNCGGTERLTPTLYNSGLSGDILAVVRELIEQDGRQEIYIAGFSMGGNLVLKMAGELGERAPQELRGVVTISASLDLSACANALAESRNWVYEQHFVRRLRQRMRHKARLFPGRFRIEGLERVHSVREFDDVITAPNCGFCDAEDYYARSSALRVAASIRVPTLLLTAQDDPMIPFAPYQTPAIAGNPCVRLVAPKHGGHCGFLSRYADQERFWAEARIVEYCGRGCGSAAVASRAAAGRDESCGIAGDSADGVLQ